MSEPRQQPGRSRQDYGTPPALLEAIKASIGIADFAWDLAASETNAVTACYFTEAENSLLQPWPTEGWNWLNPPFARIGPWAEKAYHEALYRRVRTVMLVPAAVGSNWWHRWVHRKADVEFLNGRLTFVGCTAPFPKDCALLTYTHTSAMVGCGTYDVWDWRQDVPARRTACAI